MPMNPYSPIPPTPIPYRGPVALQGLAGIRDISPVQVLGALGGGILGSILVTTLSGPVTKGMKKQTRNLVSTASLSIVPVMTLIGWHMFKKGFDFEFSEQEVYGAQ